MKILLISSLFPRKGHPNNGIFNLSRVKALHNLGNEIKVIVPISLTPPERFLLPVPRIKKIINYLYNKYNILAKDKIDGFDVYYVKRMSLPYKVFWSFDADMLHLFAGRKIFKLIKEFNPDFIVSSGLNPASTYAKRIKKRFDIKYVSIIEGSDILISPIKYRGINKIIRTINNYVDRVIFVSSSFQDIVSNRYHINNTIVVKNGYDAELFRYDSICSRKKGKKVKLISVGGLNYIKGHDILLEAMKILGPNYILTIIGDGELLDKYKRFVKENNLIDRISFLGNVKHNKVSEYLNDSDIFCMPSRSESFGISAIEAMACGLPVIATKVGGLENLINEDINGLFCELNSSSLAAAINRANKKKWNYRAISDWAKNNYGWDKWANEIINVYKDIK